MMTDIFSINWLFILRVGLGFEKTMEKTGSGSILEPFGQCHCWGKLVQGSSARISLNPDVYSSVCCTLSHSQPVLYMYFFVFNNP